MTVRLAGPGDENALYDLLLGLERDNSIGYPHDEDRVRHHIRLGTERTGGIHGVIDWPEQPGRLAGSVGIIWNQFWYSREFYWHELWLFVRPECRKGTGYADDLMAWAQEIHRKFAVSVGKETPFFTSVTSRKRLDAKIRWWRRRGPMIGAIFLLR